MFFSVDAPYHSSIADVSDARIVPSRKRSQDGQKTGSPVQERGSISNKDTPKDERKSSTSSKNRAGSAYRDVRANSNTQEDIEEKSPAASPIRSNSNKPEQVERPTPARSNSNKSEHVEKPSSVRSDSVKSEHAEKRPSAAIPIRSNSKQSEDIKTPAAVKGKSSSDSAKKPSIGGSQNGGARRGSIGETAAPAVANETNGRRKSGSFGKNATATGSNTSLGEVGKYEVFGAFNAIHSWGLVINSTAI